MAWRGKPSAAGLVRRVTPRAPAEVHLGGDTRRFLRGPTQGAKIDVNAAANVPLVGKLQMDLLVAAPSCGTRRAVGTTPFGD